MNISANSLKKKQMGLILLSTISFLALFSSFLLSNLQGTFLYRKNFNEVLNKNKSLEFMEKEVHRLMLLPEISPCLIDESDPHQIIDKLKNKQGCIIEHNEARYFYFIEKLGYFPCIQSKVNGTRYITRHHRITFFSLEENAFLQLRIAYLEPYIACEDNPIIAVLPGVLSWRYFSITP